MRRWIIGAAVAVTGLTLCAGAFAASKTRYISGRRGKAPYVSVTVSGGKVTTVQWWLKMDCGYTDQDSSHPNTRIKRSGRFSYSNNWIGGGPFDTEYDVRIRGRLHGTTATVTVDYATSGLSQSPCEGKHTFRAVDSALDQGLG